MRSVEGVAGVVADGFSRVLQIDVLHGTDLVGTAQATSWSLDGDLDVDPKTTGRFRIVHPSVHGESWVPRGVDGVLSPFRATLLLTEVISAGEFERRVPLGLFDVVRVPFAQDVTATVGARWVETFTTVDDLFTEQFTEEFPGESVYAAGEYVGGREVVAASIVDVEVESLDGRVLGASFRSPRKSLASAWAEWRAVGLLPVVETVPDVTVPVKVWPAEAGSRLDDVQTVARALGGVPVVDSSGQWVLADGNTPTVTLTLGEHGTVVDLSSEVTLDGFFNVVVGDYEDANGKPLRSVWVAPGHLSPEALGRELVTYRTSDTVTTLAQANADTAAYGALVTSQETDVEVTCVYHPLLELGDHVTVDGADVSGVAVRVQVSDRATMRVVVRVRRQL